MVITQPGPAIRKDPPAVPAPEDYPAASLVVPGAPAEASAVLVQAVRFHHFRGRPGRPHVGQRDAHAAEEMDHLDAHGAEELRLALVEPGAEECLAQRPDDVVVLPRLEELDGGERPHPVVEHQFLLGQRRWLRRAARLLERHLVTARGGPYLVAHHGDRLCQVERGVARVGRDGDEGVAGVELLVGEAVILTARHDGHRPARSPVEQFRRGLARPDHAALRGALAPGRAPWPARSRRVPARGCRIPRCGR